MAGSTSIEDLLADEEIKVGPVPLRFRVLEAVASTRAAAKE